MRVDRIARTAPLVAVFLSLMLLVWPTATVASPAVAAIREPTAVGVRPVTGQVVREFKAPAHRFGPGHRGVDLRAEPGEAVRAVRTGVISWAGSVAGLSYVTVHHGAGLYTTYGDVVPDVRRGVRVRAGQVLGHVAPGRGYLDWGARWHNRGERRYFDPMLLLTKLQPVLVAPTNGV